MTDAPRLVLHEGDAALVVRANGQVELATSQTAYPSTLLVAGLALALENDEWRVNLLARTRARLEQMKKE